MSDRGKKHEGSETVFNVIRKFVKKEPLAQEFREKPLYYLPGSISDLEWNLHTISKAVLWLARSQTGKEIWVNLTGGPNTLNIALLVVSYLSGQFAKTYYTFTDKSEFLQPSGKKFQWVDVPTVKVLFDESHFDILKILDKKSSPLPPDEILSRLKSEAPERWKDIDSKTLSQVYLLKMQGVDFNRNDNTNSINPQGQQLLRLASKKYIGGLLLPQQQRDRPSREESGLEELSWELEHD